MGEEDGEDDADGPNGLSGMESIAKRLGPSAGSDGGDLEAKVMEAAKIDRAKRKRKRKRLGINVGETTLDPNIAPSKLTATLLERFVRIFVMLSQVTLTADDLVDYLLTAHHYACRIVTSAIFAAYTVPLPQQVEVRGGNRGRIGSQVVVERQG